MRYSLLQLFVLVTAACLLLGLAAYIPLPLAWGLAVLTMAAGFLSSVVRGNSPAARWWRTTLVTWLGLLLFVGMVFQQRSSIFVVEVLWLTGLPALAIGTYVVWVHDRLRMKPRRATAAAQAEMIEILQTRAKTLRGK